MQKVRLIQMTMASQPLQPPSQQQDHAHALPTHAVGRLPVPDSICNCLKTLKQ